MPLVKKPLTIHAVIGLCVANVIQVDPKKMFSFYFVFTCLPWDLRRSVILLFSSHFLKISGKVKVLVRLRYIVTWRQKWHKGVNFMMFHPHAGHPHMTDIFVPMRYWLKPILAPFKANIFLCHLSSKWQILAAVWISWRIDNIEKMTSVAGGHASGT